MSPSVTEFCLIFRQKFPEKREGNCLKERFRIRCMGSPGFLKVQV